MLTALRSRSGSLQAFTGTQAAGTLERDHARALVESGYMPLSEYLSRFGDPDDGGALAAFAEPIAADRIPQQRRTRVPIWLGLLAGVIACLGPLYILGVIWLGSGR